MEGPGAGQGAGRTRTRSRWSGPAPAPARPSLELATKALQRGPGGADLPGGHRHPGARLLADEAAGPGSAALALSGDFPVIPVAHWGTHQVYESYAEGRSSTRCRARTSGSSFGDPIDLHRAAVGKPVDARSIRDASLLIMTVVRDMVAEIRGEAAAEGVLRPEEGRAAGQAGRRRRRSGSRRSPSCRQPSRPTRPRPRTPAVDHDRAMPIERVRACWRRLLGDDVRQGARRRRPVGHAVGAAGVGGRRRSAPSTAIHDYLPGVPLPDGVTRDLRLRRGAGGRRRGGAGRAQPGAAGEPAGVPRLAAADGADRLAGQGRRDRHRTADERGDRAGRAGRSRPDRGAHRAQPGGGDRRWAGRPRRCWPAPTTSGRSPSRWPARTPYFRPYTITDVIGAEIAGTGKNIIALACGIADGLGLGLNTSASLITRGLQRGLPARRRARRRHRPPSPGWPASATWSPPARRRCPATAPSAAGWPRASAWRRPWRPPAGRWPRAWSAAGRCATSALRHKIDMPITESVYQVCYRHLPPAQMISYLMDRPHSPE